MDVFTLTSKLTLSVFSWKLIWALSAFFFFDSWHSVISLVERGRRDISVYSGCLCFFPKELRVVLLPSSGVLLQLSVPIVEMASLTSS